MQLKILQRSCCEVYRPDPTLFTPRVKTKMMRVQTLFIPLLLILAAVVLFSTSCGSGNTANAGNVNNQPVVIDVTTAQAVIKPDDVTC